MIEHSITRRIYPRKDATCENVRNVINNVVILPSFVPTSAKSKYLLLQIWNQRAFASIIGASLLLLELKPAHVYQLACKLVVVARGRRWVTGSSMRGTDGHK